MVDSLRLVAILACTVLVGAFGHGLDVQRPSDELRAMVQPPIDGAEPFARALLQHGRNLFSADDLQVLDSISTNLRLMEQARGGSEHGLEARDADVFRWVAETNLLHLLANAPGMVALDFRKGLPEHKPDAPIELDQQINIVLLKVVTGDSGTNFVVHEMDMTSERDRKPYTVQIGSNSTTFVMVKLEQVPSDTTITHLVFEPPGGKSNVFLHGVTLRSKPSGQMAFEVLDSKGKPTPALVRLTSVTGQRLWEPAGAVDLSPMMNDVTSLPIYGPGRGYNVYLPGPFAGRYWVVPGPFEMALPGGDWEAHILHGLEHVPVRETFQVAAGKWTRKTVRLERWVDMPHRGWYSGDDHVHSRLMDSEDGEKLMAFTRAADIHVSNVLEMGNEMRTWYAQRGFGPEFRVGYGNHWLVPGQEDPRSLLGHAIGLNLKAKVRDLEHYYLNDWIAAQIHQQGGLYGHTHVGNSEVKELFTERQMALFTPMNIVDFNSILQTKLGLDLYYDFLNIGLKMTASSGSDTPYGGTVGCVRLYAYCGPQKAFSPDAWFSALRKGRTFVTTGPMLDFKVANAMPGDELQVKGSEKLRITARASGYQGGSAPVLLKVVRFGRSLAEKSAAKQSVSEKPTAKMNELSIVMDLDVTNSCWLALYAKGADGSEAHTTPVYVIRDGERFWDPEQAPLIIHKQLQILDEIEAALAEARRIRSSGGQHLNFYHRWPAEQADLVLERVAKSREIYQEMQSALQARPGSK